MIIIQLNWQKGIFCALTNIYASKHAGACCLHYPAFSGVSKYQIADKLHNEIGPVLCNFWYFHFYSPQPNRNSLGEFLTFSSPFTAACLPANSIHNTRAIVVCAFDVQVNAIPRDATTNERRKNAEKCNNKFDNFNTF